MNSPPRSVSIPRIGKREQQAGLLESCQHRFLAPIQQGKTFGPPGCDVGERHGVQVTPLDVCATMGHQVRFQKAGLDLAPLLERADGNLLLQERPARVVERPR